MNSFVIVFFLRFLKMLLHCFFISECFQYSTINLFSHWQSIFSRRTCKEMMSTTGLGLRDCFVIFLELSYVSHYCVGHHLQNVHSSYFFLSNSAFGVASYLLLFREKFQIMHYLDTSIAYYCFRCFSNSDMMYYFIIFS